MKKTETIKDILYGLWKLISLNRKKQFIYLLIITVLSSFAEILSLASVLPFVSILTNPVKFYNLVLVHKIALFFNITNPNNLILPFTILFGLSAILAGILRLILLKYSIRLGNNTGSDLSIKLYKITLYQNYEAHISRGSSEILSGITQKIGLATSVLISVVTVITSFILFIAIMFTILAMNPLIAVSTTMSFGLSYYFIAIKTRKSLANNSKKISTEQTSVIKSLQEGLGSIRDVIIDGTQSIYLSVYSNSIKKLQNATGINTYINQAPRYAMESLGIAIIAIFVIIFNYTIGIESILPILGILAFAAQRILPIMQQIYSNWAVVIGSKGGLIDVLELLNQPISEKPNKNYDKQLIFDDSLTLRNISFKYSNTSKMVLNDINLTIKKGDRIGVIGSTGSGKSTLMDVILGLLKPTTGKIFIDNTELDQDTIRLWQNSISHVPQGIYLTDGTITNNIAFGISNDYISRDQVYSASEKASLTKFINELPMGYESIVGERGVKLSGGQKQRIGIARALYKKSDLIIFDEATSALDNDTEKEVMDAIESLGSELTIIIIAHRITTLKKCNKIIKLEDGKLVNHYTYQELANSI